MNVLKRIVIPRTNLSVGYILTELEEIAREEFHRLKKVKEKKRKDYELRHKKDEPKKQDEAVKQFGPCKICGVEMYKPEIQTTRQLSDMVEPNIILAISPESVDNPDFNASRTVQIKGEPKIEPCSCKISEANKDKPEIQTTKESENIDASTIHAITPESDDKPELVPYTTGLIKYEPGIQPCSCRICGAETNEPEIQTTKQLSENIEPATIIAITPESADIPDLIPSKTKSDRAEKELKVTIQQEPELLEPFVELYATPSEKSSVIDEAINDTIGGNRLEYLKSHLNELIALGKEFVQTGVDRIDINNFLKMCEEAKSKLEQFFKVDDYPKVDTKLEQKLEHLKIHLREVIEITKEFKPEATLTSSVENFIKMCEDVDEKLDIYKQAIATPSNSVDNDNVRLEEFKDIITDVENITKEYNKRGLLSPSAEAFIQSCCEMKLKVDKYMCCKHNRKVVSIQPSVETQKEPSIVKQKSEVKPAQEPSIHSEIKHLIEHIDETIDLGKEAREEGLISESVEDIIESFSEIKSRITSKEEKPEKLQNLQLNIEEIINLTEKLKTDGIVTASVDDFLKLCEETMNKLYVSQNRSPTTLQNSKANSFSSVDSCMNNTEANLTNEGGNRILEEKPLFDVAPCDSCNAAVREKVSKPSLSKESVCVTCSKPEVDEKYEKDIKYEEDEDTLRSQMQTVLNSPDQSQEVLYDSSKKDVLQRNDTEDKQSPLENQTEPSSTEVDSKLGYFEKKLQKKVKVTRTQHTDGTIWEKKETITIRKERHDPTETSLAEDDDDMSDDTSDDNIHEQVNLCIVPNLTQRGFIGNFRQTRSDSFCKHTSYVEPCLRYCLSLDDVCLTMREQVSFYDNNNLNEIELLDTDLNYMNCLRHPFYKNQNE